MKTILEDRLCVASWSGTRSETNEWPVSDFSGRYESPQPAYRHHAFLDRPASGKTRVIEATAEVLYGVQMR